MRPPFLRRSLKGADAASADILARGGLAIKVCVKTYRMFFVPNSEDVLVREPSAEEVTSTELGVQRAREKRRKWIEGVELGKMFAASTGEV
jgi:paired amphipathic helix protein Sin3a